MKILLLPFHFRNFFAEGTRVSGIDECMLKQYRVLSKDNSVRVFLGYSDIKQQDFIVFSREKENTKELLKKDKNKILDLLRKTITEFKPDVILSNYGFNDSLYKFLGTFNIPILYLSHSLPGAPADVFGADKLDAFLSRGHSMGCVSEFHKMKTIEYYGRNRSTWAVQPNIPVHVVVPSSFAVKQPIIEGKSKLVRHISACNEEKGTFIIHAMADGSDLVAEIFTTTKHVGGDKEQEYLEKNLSLYGNKPNLLINFDVPHVDIMQRIKDSSAFFVGKAQSDTFTITSIEALQNGVPLMIYGDKEVHPASSFVEPDYRKYVRYFRTKKEFYDIVNDFSKMTINDRSDLADSCVRTMGESMFRTRYTEALESVIEKYNSAPKDNPLESMFG